MSETFDIESVIESYKGVVTLNVPKASQEFIKIDYLSDGTKVRKLFLNEKDLGFI